MISIWCDCIIAGLKSFDSVKASRKAEVKAELDSRLASGELSQETYNTIFGLNQEQPEDEDEDEAI
ncbi:MAG: hypothetical protein IJ520_09955 [Synergistaceae bacterium]|nr:hypothetical protein [Synergistaceae bacterium]MBR1602150.1 hypothetical protein [Synergistaceae bacterium]